MSDEKNSYQATGFLKYDSECKCLNLNSYQLHSGTEVEVCISDTWIYGQVTFNDNGCYLLTLDGVEVRLQDGLLACIPNREAAHPQSLETIPPSILIVDDDLALLHALSRSILLRIPAAQVDTTASPHEALRLLQKRQYDVIVSDIKMPEMDGLELLGQIQQRQPEIPIILITGQGEHDVAIRALRGGAYDYIQKPIERDVFFAALHRAIQTCQLRRQVVDQQRILELHARSLERVVQQRTQELVEAQLAKDKVVGLVSQQLSDPVARLKELTQLLQRKLLQYPQTGSGRSIYQHISQTELVDASDPKGARDLTPGGSEAAEIVQHSFTEIAQALAQTEDLLHELQDTAHLEAGVFIPHPRQYDLVALCHSILSEVAEATGAQLSWEQSYGPVLAEVDAQQISHVIRSLLSHISAQVTRELPTTLTVQQSAQEVMIIVRDSFPHTNLGMGFYVSRKILEQHDGHLEMQSFPGNRRTLFLTLPAFPLEQKTLEQSTETTLRPRTHAYGEILYNTP